MGLLNFKGLIFLHLFDHNHLVVRLNIYTVCLSVRELLSNQVPLDNFLLHINGTKAVVKKREVAKN